MRSSSLGSLCKVSLVSATQSCRAAHRWRLPVLLDLPNFTKKAPTSNNRLRTHSPRQPITSEYPFHLDQSGERSYPLPLPHVQTSYIKISFPWDIITAFLLALPNIMKMIPSSLLRILHLLYAAHSRQYGAACMWIIILSTSLILILNS